MLKKLFSLLLLALSFNSVHAAAMDRNSIEFYDNVIFPLRSFMDQHLEEVGFVSEEDRKASCAYLDPDAMVSVLQKTFELGKRFVEEDKIEDVKSILTTLLLPNQVFNTEGLYEDYMLDTKHSDLKCQTFNEFAREVEKRALSLFPKLLSECYEKNVDKPETIDDLKTYIRQIDSTVCFH